MPAIDREVEDMEKEGIKLELLVAPIGITRDGDQLKTVIVQRMELGEPDDSGRRRPVVKDGSEFTMKAGTFVFAIGQGPNPIIASTTPGRRHLLVTTPDHASHEASTPI